MKRIALAAFTLALLTGPAFGQDSDLLARTIENLDATGNAPVFFNLAKGTVVDSTEAWDISFNRSNISVFGQVTVADRKFDSVYEAPTSALASDIVGVAGFPSGAEGWFNYDPMTHIVEPVPQRVFIVKTASDMYAKIQILGYYKDGAMGDDPGAEPRFYTFRYVLNTSGSSELK